MRQGTDADSAAFDAGHLPLSHALLGRPRSTGELLDRPRLIERFDAATRHPLTIVSGEPAAGKTSVVLEWMRSEAGRDRPVGWLTVDAMLNDPGLFWRYMLAVAERLGVVGDDLARALDDGSTPGESWLTTFTNRLAQIPGDPVLVLDDFHLIERQETLTQAQALIERLTTSTHIVLLSRVTPPWRLDRWRTNGVLCEIRSDELRFTVAETAELMESTSPHELTPGDVELLARRTEGWAGGLRLAQLSMAHTADPSAFIETFAGDDELVSSYLFREVLESQAEEICDFLLDVSVLDDFSPELCDIVREARDSTGLLDRCRAANLFVVDLDTTGTRCRLHSLFAQLLRARLAAHDPERLSALHTRASLASEARGDVRAAVRHAAAAGADDRTGALIAQYASRLAHLGEFETIENWISLLPSSPGGALPETSLGLASSLCLAGHPAEAESVLDRLIEHDVPERVEYAAIQLRGMIAMFTGRVDNLLAILADLDREVPAGELPLPFEPRRLAAYLEAIATYYADDLAAARHASQLASEIEERPSLFYVEAPGQLARVCVAEGNLTEAVRHAEESLRRADALGSAETAVRLKPNLVLGDVDWERNELDAAAAHLRIARRSVRPLLWQAVIVQLASSRLLASHGELDRARGELADAGGTYWTSQTSPVLQVLLCRSAIDLALRAGDLGDALRWAHTFDSIEGVELGHAIELRLARERRDADLAALVDRRLSGDEPVPRRIDTLLAAAGVLSELGDDERARELVGRATVLGEPERFVRRFVESDERVHKILTTFAASPDRRDVAVGSPVFIDLLIEGLRSSRTAKGPPTAHAELIDPMSNREMEILDGLLEGLSYREIADHLYISRNTVKTHVRHVYTKLGVASRDAAVEEARRLGIT